MTRKVTDLDLAFPANVDDWLPAWKDIPAEFKSEGGYSDNDRNPYVVFVSTWFFRGINLRDWDMELKDGVSQEEATELMRQVKACMGSFAPKHEHKTAGCAYMLSKFLTPPKKHDPNEGVMPMTESGAIDAYTCKHGRTGPHEKIDGEDCEGPWEGRA